MWKIFINAIMLIFIVLILQKIIFRNKIFFCRKYALSVNTADKALYLRHKFFYKYLCTSG